MASVDFFTVSSPRVFAPDFCQNRAWVGHRPLSWFDGRVGQPRSARLVI